MGTYFWVTFIIAMVVVFFLFAVLYQPIKKGNDKDKGDDNEKEPR